MTITTIGLDLAKNAFQIHAEDATGTVVIRKQIRRNKNDMADAEAICEAVTRPNMRFVPIKSTDQQATLMLHRARDLMVRHHTSLINAFRGHLSELGIIAATGKWHIQKLIQIVEANPNEDIPAIAIPALKALIHQIAEAKNQIDALEKAIVRTHRQNPESRRLATIPGIGPITASALSATIADASTFTSGRQLAAWLGLTPKQHSSGGKDRLGRITKHTTYMPRTNEA